MILAVCVFTAMAGSPTVSTQAGALPATSVASATKLCDALTRIRAGERIKLTVSGIYEVGPEAQVLYDPDQWVCRADVQPATWVEFAKGATNHEFDRLIATDRRVYVTFTGELHGPEALKPDDERLPVNVAAANRLSARYGHLHGFRSELVVNSILTVKPVPKATPTYAFSYIPPSPDRLPVVIQAETPHYPNLARRAGIAGEVHVEADVAGGRIVRMRIVSGDRLLAAETTANMSTWRFDATVSTTFRTRFIYQLEQRLTGSDPNLIVELRMPSLVRIVSPTDDW
jgi:hypothetical protein